MYYIHTYTSNCYEGQFRLHKIALIRFKIKITTMPCSLHLKKIYIAYPDLKNLRKVCTRLNGQTVSKGYMEIYILSIKLLLGL